MPPLSWAWATVGRLRVRPLRRGSATASSRGRVARHLLLSRRGQLRRLCRHRGSPHPAPAWRPRGAGFPGPAAPGPGGDQGRDAAGGGGLEREGVGLRAPGGWKGTLARGRAGEGPRPIQIRGGRVHVGARRPHARPGRANCAAPGASSRQPASSPVPARERKDGDLRVRSARPARFGAERGTTPSAPGGGWGWAAQAADGAAQAQPPSRPRRPRRVRPSPASRPGPGGLAGRGSRAAAAAGDPGLTSVPKRRPLRPGPGNRDRGRGRRWRRGGGGGPCGAEGGRSRSRCLGRAPSGARPAQPALAAEGAAGSAPGLDSFTDTTPGRPAPRRDTPAPRRLPPPAGRPASPPLGVTHPGAHTPSRRPSLPLAHTALLTPLSGFVSAHTHVLTQIPSLHTPSLAPFPPHFLEESPYSFRALPAPHQPPRLSPNPRLT